MRSQFFRCFCNRSKAQVAFFAQCSVFAGNRQEAPLISCRSPQFLCKRQESQPHGVADAYQKTRSEIGGLMPSESNLPDLHTFRQLSEDMKGSCASQLPACPICMENRFPACRVDRAVELGDLIEWLVEGHRCGQHNGACDAARGSKLRRFRPH